MVGSSLRRRSSAPARRADAGTGIPAPLAAYLVAVALGGPALAVAAFTARPRLGDRDTLAALILAGLAALACRYPLHLGDKTNVNVAGAAYLAAVFAFPVAVPGLLAYGAVALGQLRRRRVDPLEILFNAGQTALYVTAGALAYAAGGGLVEGRHGWSRDGALLGVAVIAAAVSYLANTALVAAAISLQIRVRPDRVWRQHLDAELPAQAALAALGGVGAVLATTQPLLLPVLALPVALVRRALREHARLREDTHAALGALVEVVELRDAYTAGHSRRVAETARALALRLGLTVEDADQIASAGRVHDVGKVAIDPAVLAKPGALNEAEWAEMRRHPALGADVVARFAAYGDGHRLVRSHHERWDGGGYPDGLAGEAIPLGARILAVADTFDALTTARPYRQAMGREAALRVLAAGAGTQWDRRVVAAMSAHASAALDPAAGDALPLPAVPRGNRSASSANAANPA